MNIKILRFLYLLLFLFSMLAYAQEDVRKISVTGKSSITLDAQFVTITIQVKELREKMAESYATLNGTLDKLFSALIESGVSEKDITKSIIDQGAQYDWQKNTRILKGYYSSCVVNFDVNDLKLLPAVYQILARYEQVSIRGTDYKRNDNFEKRKIEFKKALAAAKEKATYMASLMGCTLGKVRIINEVSTNDYVARSVYSNEVGVSQSANVDFGSVTVSATVYVEFYLE